VRQATHQPSMPSSQPIGLLFGKISAQGRCSAIALCTVSSSKPACSTPCAHDSCVQHASRLAVGRHHDAV
jgi:hypothetical protein